MKVVFNYYYLVSLLKKSILWSKVTEKYSFREKIAVEK